MIGGGQGSFIGAVHRMAIALDGTGTLVAGALSSDPARAKQSGAALGLPASRSYDSHRELLDGEASLPLDQRAQFIVIVTPNASHADLAIACLRAGFPVVLDKPLTRTLEEARSLQAVVRDAGLPFAITYNYTGYPLIRHAAELVRQGALGTVRKVVVEYHQGWLTTALEVSGQKQASWRTDPAQAGAGALGDIGTHAENLLSTVAGLEIESVSADIASVVPGRRVDDDAVVTARCVGGARALLSISQVATGEENNLSLRVYGDTAGLSWRQEDPNQLWLLPRDGPRRLITRGALTGSAAAATRLPPGHPEGFIEGFANVYRSFAGALRANLARQTLPNDWWPAPGIAEGVRGVRFVHACLESARSGGTSVRLDALSE